MKTKRLSRSVKTIILALILLVLISPLILTIAYFSDKKEYSGTLDFGAIELDVSGTGIDNTKKSLKFDVTRSNGTYTAGGKVMPGDIVNIPIKVTLTSESEAAYYMIFLSDPKGIFESGAYFSDYGTNVYISDGTKIYNQSTKATVTDKIVGKLSKGTTGHDITISATISTDFEEQNVNTIINCTVCAIQQANLNESTAKNLLNQEFGFDLFNVGSRAVASVTQSEGVNTATRTITGKQIMIGLTGSNYWYPNQLSSDYEVTADKIRFTTNSNINYGLGLDALCTAGDKYILTYESAQKTSVAVTYYKEDGSSLSQVLPGSGTVFTVPANATGMIVVFKSTTAGTEMVYSNFRLVKVY